MNTLLWPLTHTDHSVGQSGAPVCWAGLTGGQGSAGQRTGRTGFSCAISVHIWRSPLWPGAVYLSACHRFSPCRIRGSKQMNTLQCARYVYQTEGIRGFYRGLTASYAGISETIICFAIYESLKKYLKEGPLASSTSGTEKNSTSFFGLMAAAALSKGCASCVAYPHGMSCLLLPKQSNSWQVCHLSLSQDLCSTEAHIQVECPLSEIV